METPQKVCDAYPTGLLPQGLVTAEQAALVLQIIAFSQCAELPEALIRQAWADARVCFGEWEG